MKMTVEQRKFFCAGLERAAKVAERAKAKLCKAAVLADSACCYDAVESLEDQARVVSEISSRIRKLQERK